MEGIKNSPIPLNSILKDFNLNKKNNKTKERARKSYLNAIEIPRKKQDKYKYKILSDFKYEIKYVKDIKHAVNAYI